jgi:hypothetical protein
MCDPIYAVDAGEFMDYILRDGEWQRMDTDGKDEGHGAHKVELLAELYNCWKLYYIFHTGLPRDIFQVKLSNSPITLQRAWLFHRKLYQMMQNK